MTHHATRGRSDGAPLARRDLVRIGGLSALGLGLGDVLGWERLARSEKRSGTGQRASSCILIWLDGGPSHIETWDPKPEAPIEVRGPLESITTRLPGVQLSECLQRTATIMDRLAVVRSVTSPLGEHNFGTHYLMTGYRPSAALAYPTIGATVAQTTTRRPVLPPNIAIPKLTGKISGNGYLPTSTRPFAVGGNPGKPGFQVRDLDFYKGLDIDRLGRRRRIVEAFDRFEQAQAASSAAGNTDLERAYNLVASEEARQAFRLSDEPAKLRQRYGNGNSLGQGCLLARRLVERGVRFVTVTSSGWDTHQDILKLKERFPTDRNALIPSLDRALSALVGDLGDRGMLEKTLVVVMGEFGRTPKINARGGRDHWPGVFSVLLAGGGVRGGQIVGQSDAQGESPAESPVTPADLATTIYTLLGIDPATELHTVDGRPVRVAPDGARVVKSLIG